MARVLILHTGGTLGMKGTPLEPGAYATHLEEHVPELAQLAEIESEIICNLDSSDMTPDEWTELAEAIARARDDYDGFVVIHGTDTMAFTASALAYALRGLNRPVVFTGAQRPLAALRSDARRNLVDAVDVATRDVPEVAICFDGLLFRGCRATKANAHDYRAFETPGTEPLARLGVNIELSPSILRFTEEFSPRTAFDPGVAVLRTWPGIDPAIIDAVVASGVRGLVLAAYGVGTAPTSQRPIGPAVERAVKGGVDVLIVSQSTGTVTLGMYQNSLPLQSAGAIGGGKMRIEAAVPKLMHALALHPSDRAARREYLVADIAGELG